MALKTPAPELASAPSSQITRSSIPRALEGVAYVSAPSTLGRAPPEKRRSPILPSTPSIELESSDKEDSENEDELADENGSTDEDESEVESGIEESDEDEAFERFLEAVPVSFCLFMILQYIRLLNALRILSYL